MIEVENLKFSYVKGKELIKDFTYSFVTLLVLIGTKKVLGCRKN